MGQSIQESKSSHQKASLNQLEGKAKAKTIEAKDRQAINEALTDQTNITVMTSQGLSSQRSREEKKGGREVVRKPAV